MTDNLTISGLALRIYLKHFYNNNIPVVDKHSLYHDIKQSYYGGITEVYKPYGKNLFYYDVNSLYPYVALQDMPGLECSKIEYFFNKTDIKDLFGFYYCKIESPLDSYLGLLPVRTKSGINFPVGKWEGWYFSEELKFAQENGYTIQVIKGYTFNRELDVFKEYVNKVYSIKANTLDKTQKAIAKSLLNNLLGRFGIMLDKPVTDLVSIKKFNEISLMFKITSYTEVSDTKILVTYIPKLDLEVITSHGLDIVKIANTIKDQEIQSVSVSSIPISAAVTAYGRIHMNKIKLDILKSGGSIYYSDTDSIVTDKKLPDYMVDSKEIGKLKLEYEVKEGIFISGKTYWLTSQDELIVNKAKGINSSSLSYEDYTNLLQNKNVYTATKKQSKIDWSVGHVVIEEKDNITINSDSYTKRAKIYNDEVWVDTKPVFINDMDKSLIPYKINRSFIVINNPIKGIYSSSYINQLKYTQDNTLRNTNRISQWLFYCLIFLISCISSLAYLHNMASNYEENTEDVSLKDNIPEIGLTEENTEDISLKNNTTEIILPEENTEDISLKNNMPEILLPEENTEDLSLKNNTSDIFLPIIKEEDHEDVNLTGNNQILNINENQPKQNKSESLVKRIENLLENKISFDKEESKSITDKYKDLFNRRFEDERIIKNLNNLIIEEANDDNKSDCSVVTIVKTDKDNKNNSLVDSDTESDTSVDTVVKPDKGKNVTSKSNTSILDYKDYLNKKLQEDKDYLDGKDLYDIKDTKSTETELDKHRRRLLELKDPLYTPSIVEYPPEGAINSYKASASYREEMRQIDIKRLTKLIDILEKKENTISYIDNLQDNPSSSSEYDNEKIKKKYL